MDFALDDEQKLIVATIRRFADRDLRGWAADADRAGTPPGGLVDIGSEVGFFLDAVPAEVGGLLEGAYCHLTRALRGIELGRGCAAMAALLEANVEPALAVGTWGTDAARQQVFDAMTRWQLVATSYDARGRLTVEPDDGGGLTVSGPIGPLPALAGASHVLVAAASVTGEPALFLLPLGGAAVVGAGAPPDDGGGGDGDGGARAVRVEPMTPSGWRCARWAAVTCERAQVPAELVVARGVAAAAAIQRTLSWYRVNLAARAVGVATAAMEHAAAYGADRVQFGQPIGTFESLFRLCDENQTRIAAARALVLHAAWAVDAGIPDAADLSSRARDFAADTVTRATIDAVQIFGGYGFVNDYPVEKLMRDARAFEVLCGNEALVRVLSQRPG